MALACIEITQLAGQVAQHGRPRWSTFKLVTGLVYRQPEAAAKTNTRSRSRLSIAPGMFRGKVSSVLMVKVYTSWLVKVY
jgi:hypothetical protein